MKKTVIFLMMCLLVSAALEAKKKPFGNGLFWELKSGVLTISGQGNIPDYSAPWNNSLGNIKKIIIEYGVTSIGKSVFSETVSKTKNLKSVIIANSVTSIGEDAFFHCSSLQSIVIPNSVTTIGKRAFWSCSSLQSIVIPNSVTTIGEDAFSYCSSLTSIVIPNSVTTIGEDAFMSCENLQSVEILSPEISIGKNAFFSCNIHSVILPISLLEKGESYWKYCYLPVDVVKNYKKNLRDKNGKAILFPDDIKERGGYTSITEMKNGIRKYYKVSKGGFYGLTDKDGRIIIPTKMNRLESAGNGFLRFKLGEYYGIVNYEGRIIIPASQKYTSIQDYNSNKGSFAFTKKGYKGYCDDQGREFSTTRVYPTSDEIKAKGSYASVVEMNNGSTKYYKVCKGGRYGLTDIEGREIVPTEMEVLESAGSGFLKYKINSFWGVMDFTGKIIIDTDRGYTSIGNFVSFTKRFPYTMVGWKGECDINGQPISKIKVETSQQTTSEKKSLKNEESTNETKTVIVEHHRDLVPVQEWVQCNICYGDGRCHIINCTNGWNYGTRMACLGCGGDGRCHFCNGQGGRYQTFYR